MRKPKKYEKTNLQKHKVHTYLVCSIIYTINRIIKTDHRLLKKINEDKDIAIKALYNMKHKLLHHFFEPTEIHLINGKKFLFFETMNFNGFHSKVLDDTTYKKLNIRVVDRSHTPKIQKLDLIDLDFCLKVFQRYKNLEII